jgi:hypothetical protein
MHAAVTLDCKLQKTHFEAEGNFLQPRPPTFPPLSPATKP